MKILVTGAAGFIGFHLCGKLLKSGYEVIGIDNINDYYDTNLKYDRLIELGIERKDAKVWKRKATGNKYGSLFKFVRLSLEDKKTLSKIFRKEQFSIVCNLAAQAGVRYSLENPETYIDSNIVGFLNILECCRNFNIEHLVYASSSSVYGLNKKVPFKATDNVDTPVSLYAASKKSNELMAHCYSHLFKFASTGLRFFTVYGPWGRPDMAMFLFVDAMLKGKSIQVFNNGNMERDFTFINDIVKGITHVIEKKVNLGDENQLYKVYNIGNNSSVRLMSFIEAIEKKLGIISKKDFMPMQPGDVEKTWANVDDLINDFNYSPSTTIEKGVSEFIDWYKLYYNI